MVAETVVTAEAERQVVVGAAVEVPLVGALVVLLVADATTTDTSAPSGTSTPRIVTGFVVWRDTISTDVSQRSG